MATIERKSRERGFCSLGRSRRGELDADGESTAFRLAERCVAPVSCEDPGDDGEAEAGSAGFSVA